MAKHRDAAQSWAALAIVLGLAIAAWAFFLFRPVMPMQDLPVAQPTSISSTSPSPAPSPPGATPTPTATAEPALYLAKPRNGSKIGTITLPKLKLSWPIFEGTSNHQLARGVGHYRGSVLPGMSDNTVLSGHRTTVFNRLGELSAGDNILVKTSAGTFTYRVRSFRIVKRTNRTVIVPTPTAVLTVTTCYPFNNIGATDHAFVVTADLVNSALR